MGKWTDIFTTKDSETQEDTDAKVKVNDEGYVSDMIYGLEKDTDNGTNHGHVWGLDSENDEDIGGRQPDDD